MPSRKNKIPAVTLFRKNLDSNKFCETYLKDDRYFVLKENKKETRLTGLTKAMERVFYPDFQPIYKKRNKSVEPRKYKWGGLHLGSVVHDQIRLFINSENLSMLNKDFYEYHSKVDPYTKKALAWLMKNKLDPIKSEMPVCDRKNGIGTAADLICSDIKGNLVLVEWKTGMENTFENHDNKKMKLSASKMLYQCPKDFAVLQTLLTSKFFEKEYGVTFKKTYVVHIHSHGLKEYSYTKRKYPEEFVTECYNDLSWHKLLKSKKNSKKQ